MSDSAVPIKSQSHVPLIQRRQGKSTALHLCLNSDTVIFQQQESLPSFETVWAGEKLPQKESKRGHKGRMDPEFRELKGFMELGFVFSKEEVSPRLLNLLPGLKRVIDHENRSKILGFQELPLENWELPSTNATGVEMKENLKLWARCVASTLKC